MAEPYCPRCACERCVAHRLHMTRIAEYYAQRRRDREARRLRDLEARNDHHCLWAFVWMVMICAKSRVEEDTLRRVLSVELGHTPGTINKIRQNYVRLVESRVGHSVDVSDTCPEWMLVNDNHPQLWARAEVDLPPYDTTVNERGEVVWPRRKVRR